MNRRINLTGAMAMVFALAAASTCLAANLYYDVNPATADIDGGSAGWSDSNWKTTPDGTAGIAWTDGDSAVFAPIAGSPSNTTVTLDGTVTTGSGGVSFTGAGYTLTGGALNIGSAWFNMGQPAAIQSALTRLQVTNNAELVISGGGTLTGRAIIGSAGSDSRVRQTGGDITVNEYMMIGGNHISNSKGEYVLESGTLTIKNGIYFGWGFSTSYGTFTQNGGMVETKDNVQGIQLGIQGGHGTYNLNGGTLLSTFGVNGGPYTYQTFVFGGGLFKARATNAAQSTMSASIADSKTALIDTQSFTLTLPCTITGASAQGLTKGGSGILALSGANTYAGVTLISNGTLRVNNATGSGTGSSSVIITNGAALDGTGTISGAVTIAENGILSGGADGTGTLTLNQTPTLAQGVKFRPSASGTSYGLLHSDGDLDLSKLTLELTAFAQPVPGTYTVATCDGELIGSFSATNLPSTYVVNVDPVGKIVQITRGAMYVSNSGNDANGGATWATAKATIQAAVDNVGVNGTVLVSNGLYTTGSYLTPGYTLNNRVVITNEVFVRSLVPYGAVIQGPGASAYNTGSALRCVFMNAGVLDGFVIEGGATAGGGLTWNTVGGGIAISSATAYATNCVIRNCKAYGGGGTYYGVIRNCVVSNNVSVSHGGGTYDTSVYGCTINNNSAGGNGGGAIYKTVEDSEISGNTAAVNGGGAYNVTGTRCVIRNNACAGGSGGGGAGVCMGTYTECLIVSNTVTGGNGGGAYNATLYRCQVTDNTQAGSPGNGGGMVLGTAYSTLFARNQAVSVGGTWKANLYSCTVVDNSAGSNVPGIHYGGVGEKIYNCTVFGNTGGNGYDIGNLSSGSDVKSSLAGSASMALAGITIVPAGTDVFSDPDADDYTLCPGSPAINSGDNAINPTANTLDLAGKPRVLFGATDGGAYEFSNILVAPGGSDANSGLSWSAAKGTIQGGVDAAGANGVGVTVLVTNGVYAAGSHATPGGGSTLNRVVITNGVTVSSVNGASVTAIQGAGTYNVAGATRCVFMNSGVLDGFTLENGATMGNGGTHEFQRGGGGVCIMKPSPGTAVKNCVIRNNTALTGGGVSGGQDGPYTTYAYRDNATISDCAITNNTAGYGGGVAYYAAFDRCTIMYNTATAQGGGGYDLKNGVSNSLIAGNTAASNGGGGVYIGTLRNCTVTANVNGGARGEGATHPLLVYNSIVWGNGSWEYTDNTTLSSSYTADPSFRDAVNGDYRLTVSSPCLNAGDNALVYGTRDLDGRSRVSFGTADIGAYELPEYLTVTFDVSPGVYAATSAETMEVQIPTLNGVYGSYIPTEDVVRSGYQPSRWTSQADGEGIEITADTPLVMLEDHAVYLQWRIPGLIILVK